MRSMFGYLAIASLLGCAGPPANGNGGGGAAPVGGHSNGGAAGVGGEGGILGQGGAGGAGATSAVGGAAPFECPENDGSGGAGECAEVGGVQQILATAPTAFFLPFHCPVFGPGHDEMFMAIPNGTTGVVSLALPSVGMACGETDVCVYLHADLKEDGYFDKVLMAKSGTLDLGSTSPPYDIAGSLSDVEFVEVLITSTSPPVVLDDGSCATLPQATFEVVGPAPGWSCDPGLYDETSQGNAQSFCDCACGAFDPDCSDAANIVLNCKGGEVCDSIGECVPA